MHIPLQDKGAHCRGNTSAGSTLNEFCKNFAKQNSRISASSTTGAVSREGLNHSAWGRAPWLTKTNTIRLPRSARTPSLSSHVFSSRKNARALKKKKNEGLQRQTPTAHHTQSYHQNDFPLTPHKKKKQKCDRPPQNITNTNPSSKHTHTHIRKKDNRETPSKPRKPESPLERTHFAPCALREVLSPNRSELRSFGTCLLYTSPSPRD